MGRLANGGGSTFTDYQVEYRGYRRCCVVIDYLITFQRIFVFACDDLACHVYATFVPEWASLFLFARHPTDTDDLGRPNIEGGVILGVPNVAGALLFPSSPRRPFHPLARHTCDHLWLDHPSATDVKTKRTFHDFLANTEYGIILMQHGKELPAGFTAVRSLEF